MVTVKSRRNSALECSARAVSAVSSSVKQTLRILILSAVVLVIALPAFADADAEKPNTVLIHPGETIYVTFQRDGGSLKLLRLSPSASKGAQVVLNMASFNEDVGIILKVENRFNDTLSYRAEMRLLTRNKRKDTSVMPVRAGNLSFEQWPHMIEELALYGFELKPQ